MTRKRVAWGAIGLGIGAAIGAAFNHHLIGVWMVIGAGVGLLIQGVNRRSSSLHANHPNSPGPDHQNNSERRVNG